MVRRSAALAAALVMAALVTPAARAAGCGPDSIEVIGRILEPPVAPQDGVACCELYVTITGASGSFEERTTRTRPGGRFSACLPCSPVDDSFTVMVTSFCCSGRWSRTFDGCIDPLTGRPRIVDMGDLECLDIPTTGMTALTGLVECRSGTLLEPVADCSILVRDASGAPRTVTRSAADGTWDLCVACPVFNDVMFVETQCCDDLQAVPIVGCPEVQPTDTVVCNPCPVPPCPSAREVEIVGNVHCSVDADGDGVLDPMAGCPVQLTYSMGCGSAPPPEVVVTDAAGDWRTCVPCPASGDCTTWSLTYEATCCASGVQTTGIEGCPPSVRVGDLVCSTTPPGDCSARCPSGEAVVRGRVTCADPVTGDPVPVQTTVSIAPLCSPSFVVDTDPDGYYTACVPCPCGEVRVTAQSCGASATRPVQCGIENVIDLSCGTCSTLPNPCAPEMTVSGRVTCDDFVGGGGTRGMPDCPVVIECRVGTGPTITVVTDANGDYEACYPCGPCTNLLITPTCCAASQEIVPVLACEAVRVDLHCGDCQPARPCAGPESVQVTGLVHCAQPGGPVPIGGCDVALRGLDAAGNEVSSATTATIGSGQYGACLSCAGGSLALIEATAGCCGAQVLEPVVGCPPTQTLSDLECTNCSPCPPGMTRIQGRVRCRGGGVVPACPLRIFVPQCAGPELVFEAFTDDQGNYRLCVPCPCPGGVVRVTTYCCPATRAVQADSCGPIFPVPTIFCDTPCR